MNRGFTFILILGLLGALVIVSLLFWSVSQSSQKISQYHLFEIKARQLAVSGLEFSIKKYYENFLYFDQQQTPVALGPGTLSAQGDTFTTSIQDVNGKININDGIYGGEEEAKSYGGEYRAHDLDPFPKAESGMDYQLLGSVPSYRGPSGFSNLRLRRLLNSYGEVHRFVDQICDGAPNELANNYRRGGFTFSTDSHHSADSLFHESMVVSGDHALIPGANNGLGDVLIMNRPAGGYQTLSEVENLVNQWASRPRVHLSEDYLDGTEFFDFIKNDLIVSSYEIDFPRLYSEWAYGNFRYTWLDPIIEKPGDFTSRLIHGPVALEMNLPRFIINAAALINLNQSSFFVRAAVFYMPTNVTYSVESTSPNPPYVIDVFPSHITPLTGAEAIIPCSFIGMMGPVFEQGKDTMLNGVPSMGRQSHLMSLRDALHLAHAYDVYTDAQGAYQKKILNFDDFKNFLEWHELNGFVQGVPPYERVLKSNPYMEQANSEDFNAGGLFYVAPYDSKGEFTQDYISKTLPHILSGIRRLPSWQFSPLALLSPYMVHKPQYSGLGYKYLLGGEVRQGFRRVEDFVPRLTHPKVCFLPCGEALAETIGEIKNEQDEIQSEYKIEAQFKLFETRYLRTQQEFINETYRSEDPLDLLDTDEDIIIGPEFHRDIPQAAEVAPSVYLGVVGLKDFDQDVATEMTESLDPFMIQHGEFTPHVVMNFKHNPHADPPLYGFENESKDEHISPQPKPKKNFKEDPWAKELGSNVYDLSIKTNQGKAVTYGLESAQDYKYDLLTNESIDLSPFNGARFSYFNHSQNNAGTSSPFTDTLYFRLEDWLDDSRPIGESINKGLMTFWFRLPSDYDYPVKVTSYNKTPINSLSYTRLLVHLNLWEMYEFQAGSSSNITRPVSLAVGLKKTRKRGLNVFARYDSGSEQVYFGTDSFQYIGPNLNNLSQGVTNKDFTSLTTSSWDHLKIQHTDFLGFWCQSNNIFFNETIPGGQTDYDVYRWATHRSCEVSVSFADQYECGPGSWHRVSVYWNFGFNLSIDGVQRDSAKQLYIDLHDSSNIKIDDQLQDLNPQVFHQGIAYAEIPHAPNISFDYPRDARRPFEGSSVGMILPQNPSMILSLGEAHGSYQIDKLYTVNVGYNNYLAHREKMFPLWRLNSVIDNFRLWMGPQNGNISEDYFQENFVSKTRKENPYNALRYYVVHKERGFPETYEPTWVLAPSIPQNSKLLAIGARVYYPPDSADPPNTPYVYLSASNDSDQINVFAPSLISQNEQDQFFINQKTKENFRIRLQYKAFKPILDGDLSNREEKMLVYDGSGEQEEDHVTNIAWIKEVSYRFAPKNGPQLLSYQGIKVSEPKSFSLTLIGDYEDDDDDDDDGDDQPGGLGSGLGKVD